MLTDGRTDGRKVITIAHPEQRSGELKIVTVETFYIKYYSMIKILSVRLGVRCKSPTWDKQTAIKCVCHSRCVVVMLQNMRTVRCNRKWTTRIPQKASSHLLGQKSQEPQSERGY